MRILLANPNTSTAASAALLELARKAASPGTEIVSATGRFGAPLMRSLAERAIGAHALLDAVAEEGPRCDAIIVAAFGDYGSAAAAELLGRPVINLADAAFTTLRWLSRPFVIVTLSQVMAGDLRAVAASHGVGHLLGRVLAVDHPPASPEFAGLATRTVQQVADEAELILPVGPPLSALFSELATAASVPLLDSMRCAVALAEAAARLDPAPLKAVAATAAGAQHYPGLSSALQQALARRAQTKR